MSRFPGYGYNKLNAAYSFGGPKLLAETVQNATGLRIEHYMGIGFGGLVNVVNSVGGVTMCFKHPLRDAASGLHLKKGCQTLSGGKALSFVRTRHNFASQDLQREQNQRVFLKALLSKLTSPGVMFNPFSVVPAALGSVGAADRGRGDAPQPAHQRGVRAAQPGDHHGPDRELEPPPRGRRRGAVGPGPGRRLFRDLNTDTSGAEAAAHRLAPAGLSGGVPGPGTRSQPPGPARAPRVPAAAPGQPAQVPAAAPGTGTRAGARRSVSSLHDRRHLNLARKRVTFDTMRRSS